MIPKNEKEIDLFFTLIDIYRIREDLRKNESNPYLKEHFKEQLNIEYHERFNDYLKILKEL